MISYRLSKKKQGTITDPLAMLIFYTRIYYGEEWKKAARGLQAKCRSSSEARQQQLPACDVRLEKRYRGKA
jgi:hypothetical protein